MCCCVFEGVFFTKLKQIVNVSLAHHTYFTCHFRTDEIFYLNDQLLSFEFLNINDFVYFLRSVENRLKQKYSHNLNSILCTADLASCMTFLVTREKLCVCYLCCTKTHLLMSDNEESNREYNCISLHSCALFCSLNEIFTN